MNTDRALATHAGRILRAGAAIVAGVCAAVPVAAPADAAPARTVCQTAIEPGSVVPPTPWAQRMLAPQRAWAISTGARVRVAVIDSGTDAKHPQLSGAVHGGYDYLRNKAGGLVDCVGHGTAVASIIAARPQAGVGFVGVAPDAEIMPLRVTDKEAGDQDQASDAANIDHLAQAITYAVRNGARVINLSLVLYEDAPAVRAAVQLALSHNVVVVAAAGNAHADAGQSRDPLPYPAAYPGVLGVGALNEDGSRVSNSQVGPYVDLVAPGGSVLAATRVRGHAYVSGTSFAAPFVAGAAALVLAAHPELTAAQVTQRLLATASPARGGRRSLEYGRGVVDPYRAVTDQVSRSAVPAAHPLPPVRVGQLAVPDGAAGQHNRRIALAVAAAGCGAAALTLGVTVLVPRGRRRRWRPGRAPALPPAAADEDPDAAGEGLFSPVGLGRRS